jgi:hypothetical protein
LNGFGREEGTTAAGASFCNLTLVERVRRMDTVSVAMWLYCSTGRIGCALPEGGVEMAATCLWWGDWSKAEGRLASRIGGVGGPS